MDIVADKARIAAYSEWTLAQQKALWRQLADQALARWGLGAPTLTWLGYGGNAVFKVQSDAGEYVLRLQPAWRVNFRQARSELAWLKAIRQMSDLRAPCPVAASAKNHAALLVEVAHPQLPPPHSALACLFEFIHGASKPAADLRCADLRAIGRYLARLHTRAQISPPAGFDRPRLAAQGLFGGGSPYAPQRNDQILTTAQQEVCQAVARAVETVWSQLHRQDAAFGLIHADLLAKNILFTEAGIAALDFEYCGWGCYLYDLAPLLWQLKGEQPQNYAQLTASLWAGYSAALGDVPPSPDHLETLIAARQLASCRWLLNNRDHPQIRQMAPALLKGRIAELRDFLACGELQRRTATV